MSVDRMNWFREARYGLFIHWGLYAELAGYWNGQHYPYPTEWLMRNAKIPLQDYKKLAETFNPVDFNADTWARKAKEYGAKYVCITSKHHDGFALFDTKASAYNIMNTPFGRDIIAELAVACRKQGLMFCVYYSQMQDWEDPDGDGNTWDFDPAGKDFRKYFNNKVKPQVQELLTNYGEIGMIWFDTPYNMPVELCRELEQWVHQHQPNCIINGRIGYGIGDFRNMSDIDIPALAYHGDWETPMTLNNSWGFSRDDFNWKQPGKVVKMLVDVVGKGGNLLLNVGPDALGIIPEGSDQVLSTVGNWLKVNGDSIYGTQASPDLPYQIRWGGVTAKAGKLFLHVMDTVETPDEIRICNLEADVKRVYLLETGTDLPYFQSYEIARDEHRFRVILPRDFSVDLDTVIVVELNQEPIVHSLYMQFDR